MKALILGSSGQIGDAFVRQLQAESVEPIQFDIVNDVQQDLRIRTILISVRSFTFVICLFLAFDVGGSRYLSTYQQAEFISNNTLLMEHTFSLLDETRSPLSLLQSDVQRIILPVWCFKGLG